MSASPVTLMVARRVEHGRYADFNRWLNEGRELAADFAGYLGSGVLSPPADDDEYQIIFRFSSSETLAAWEHSASRHAWLARGKGLYEAPHEHRATGLDAWFQTGSSAPPRWKQAVAVWLAFFPISLIFQFVFGGVLADWALLPRVVVSTLMLTPVMVFVFIPLSMRLLAPWLQGKWSPLDLLARWRHAHRL
ncbi:MULTISPECIES: antibiotic biosynthesis monooxygenase [Halomonadaceae]|jgi:antibiotic biosynthesis monooxygenase (ABM) superfamily enzyme|uniref:Dimeric alpha-beta barrel n=2 Tax=Vreelandella titanicae TaxID=664683 RepID=L9U7I3_9GAMM|nr:MULTISPECIES: antibiotic biosynthesis monooxygenase [Halomonas]NAO97671.1 antibiotic biosynthesis monooxygenase [Halomonas sp. MG34]QGQ69181.1 antibiotic biosynthesis monooxygenase [Halomonas sp. PA16-9]UEQ04576.1 antibiotic biosynthesis monooxygenase [Halomonas profundus]ELY20865.1 Dimeric alpha-beta barrel [Halomonas titanicae BH1]KIN13943.1 antibiotic biosynthesis monooxygenase [Halomonas sp. KHS3]|tara:strand:+ start:84 stop:659 length:576 start_codon:yes stop_codon:yes gene_type:complete